jgi:polyadenylate-binding protein 2
MAETEALGLTTEDQLEASDALENGQEVDVSEGGGAGDVSLVGSNAVDDPELEAIKARVREMEEEAEKLKQLQSEVDKEMNLGSPPGITSPLNMSTEEKMEVDNRSIYVGNVSDNA